MAYLIWHIITGRGMDITKILSSQIHNISKDKPNVRPLAFPTLIIGLCAEQGVTIPPLYHAKLKPKINESFIHIFVCGKGCRRRKFKTTKNSRNISIHYCCCCTWCCIHGSTHESIYDSHVSQIGIDGISIPLTQEIRVLVDP